MVKIPLFIVTLIPFILEVTAQSPAWGQCGGIGWSGPTTCVSGSSCVASNPYYSQCIPGSTGGGSTGGGSTGGGSTGGGSTSSSSKLNDVAGAHGKYFGTETDGNFAEINDASFRAILNDKGNFGILSPGNSMKWDATEPSRGRFVFTNSDKLVSIAKQNGQRMRDSWDVVNEPLNEDGTQRSFVFTNTIGTSYIDIALKAARAADPNAKLYINDYNIENPSYPKTKGMVNLIKDLKSRGIPIDGVGIQGHLSVGGVPNIQQTMQTFADLGVDVALTEVDIALTEPVTQDKLNQQQKDYQTLAAACRAVSRCVGMTTWGFSDKYTWLGSNKHPLPWDENFNKKPAYNGVVAGFQ
ncbi:hypothetical protein VKT23_008540 [Stygiomarasmius scandens]|uniref:Beta-xylanase n=1 Tax=Marasmiellus scandens TaxID=2682957 RepID=A0ABR1JGP7_9AGAR